MRRLTAEPGRAFCGSPVGRLAPGAPADLVLFDPDRAVAHLDRRVPLEIEERAVRRPPGAGPGASARSSTAARSFGAEG